MSDSNHLMIHLHPNGVRELQLHRSAQRNALDIALIHALCTAIEEASQDPGTRVLLLSASGEYFSAGADLQWMKAAKNYTESENIADAQVLGKLLQLLYQCPKPTLAKVQGSAFGGALGLICACDIAIGADQCTFSFPEVRLGLIPAIISPYTVQAIGMRWAKKLFLTGEVFTADLAASIGLLHQAVPKEQLDQRVEGEIQALLQASEQAQVACKKLCLEQSSIDPEQCNALAKAIALLRTRPEAQEGLAAFLEKRSPSWRKQ